MIELSPTATLTQYFSPAVAPKDDRPAVLILPGGSYCHTSAREGAPVALMFNTLHCHAFVLDYTTVEKNPDVTTEMLLAEVEQSLNLILSNARNWQVNITEIMICGFSAGGHLAALAANQFHRKIARQILCYPALDLGTHPPQLQGQQSDPALTTRLSRLFAPRPVEGVHPRTPPTFLWHTGGDTTVPMAGSVDYLAGLARAGVGYEAHLFAGGVHGMALATPASAGLYPDATDPHIATWTSLLAGWLTS
jgi:acetyl esterase/lipase